MLSLDSIINFLDKNFLLPFAPGTEFYNPYNTAVLAVLFAAGVYYLALPAVKKMDIELKKGFYISMAPYIVLGGAIRTLEDIGTLEGIIFKAPAIFILMFVVAGVSLWVSKFFERKFGVYYWKVCSTFGASLAIIALFLIPIRNPLAVVQVLGLTALSGTFLWLGSEYLLAQDNLRFVLPTTAHFFDASTTVVSIINGGREKHVLASFFIDSFGLTGMFVMKSLIVIPAVYMICDDFRENERGKRDFLLFAITVLGIGLGIRNILSTMALS